MRKIVSLLIIIVAIYIMKPIWEKPVSHYIDLSFIEPVDEKVDALITSKPFTTAVYTISNATDKVVHFIVSKIPSPEDAIELEATTISTEEKHAETIAVSSIEIGDSKEFVLAQLGHPKRETQNEYGQQWFTFHNQYKQFIMISFNNNNKVNALYTNDNTIQSSEELHYGMSKNDVRQKLGEPLTEIRKGQNVFILQNTDGHDVFKLNNLYIYVFYDVVKDGSVTALQLITAELEQEKQALYAKKSTALQRGFAFQLFDLTNASRVRHGLSPLEWDDALSVTALRHSTDMALNNYFNHDNLQGQSPFDRMEQDHIRFQAAGENLAYGQSSSIFAHEGLMNSPGHRDNILLDIYSHLGVGVDFNEELQPYFTENFVLK